MQQFVNPNDLAAVWISHLHPDHYADLLALANWSLNTPEVKKIPVFGPAGWAARLNTMISEDPHQDIVGEIFDVAYLSDGDVRQANGFQISSKLVHHSVTGFGARVSSRGRVLAYSGDSGPCPALTELARDVDMFLCEAGAIEPTEFHCTYSEAREIAVRANVKKLLLTHIPYGIAYNSRDQDGLGLEIETARVGTRWEIV